MKIVWIVERLLWQNRWLFLLLFLWPYAMAAILLFPADRPDVADVVSMLHQECLYGLALVAVNGSAQLGNEQRSRRIVGVLSRAVSRRAYLASLLLAAWIPLVLYAVGFVISGSRARCLGLALRRERLGRWPRCNSPSASGSAPSVSSSPSSCNTFSPRLPPWRPQPPLSG